MTCRLGSLSAVAFAAAVAAMAPGSGWTQDPDQENPLVARVGEEEIRMSEVTDMIAGMPPQYRQVPVEIIVPFIADQLALGRIMADRARDEGLGESEAFQSRIASAERAILRDLWLEVEVDERLTDERIDAAYQEFVAAAESAGEVRARHILLETPEDAEAVIVELEAGADFADLARERSIGPSGPGGGDLGWFSQRDMVAAFAEAAFALGVGEFSTEPVETQFGWHVILVEDRRNEEAPTFEAIQDELLDGLRDEIAEEIMSELRDGADIVIYGPDGEPIDPATIIP